MDSGFIYYIYIFWTYTMIAVRALKSCCKGIYNEFTNYTFGFLFLIILTIIMAIFTTIFPKMGLSLSNNPILVIQKSQYWRLFSSFLVNNTSFPFGIIFLIFCFWVLRLSMVSLEQKLSTVYIVVELVKQTLVINLIVNLLFYPLIYLNVVNGNQIGTAGLMVPMMNFHMQDVCRDPNGEFKIFGLTCFLKKKYLPVFIMLIILGAVGVNPWQFFFLNAVLMFQHMYLTTPLFSCSKGLYLKLNSYVPNCLKIKGYIDAQNVKEQLQKVCEQWFIQTADGSSSIKAIKNTHQSHFKHRWINKQAQFYQKQQNLERESKDKVIQMNVIEKEFQNNQNLNNEEIGNKFDLCTEPHKNQDFRIVWAKKAEQLLEERRLLEQMKIKQGLVNLNKETLPQTSFDNIYVQSENGQSQQLSKNTQIQESPQEESKKETKIDNPSKAAQAIDDEQEWY